MSKTRSFIDGLAWDQIIWRNSHEKVRRMQKRIFKASRKGETKRMYFLQKLLIRSPHAKLVAVQRVTTLNKGKKTAGVDGIIATTSKQKLELAKTLQLNGKSQYVRRVWIPKPGKTEKRPLGIPTIRDRAKQALCMLALEPQWEAKFEANSYGFRPGRSTHDAIEAIFLNLHHNVDKWVFDADIRKCFDRISHDALLSKLDSFPLIQNQVWAWLKAGIMDDYSKTDKILEPIMGTPQGGIISPLLANVALHGLEEHLLDLVSSRKMAKPHPKSANGVRAKRSALGIIRYADDFVIIHRNKDIMEKVIEETKSWLRGMGLEISTEKSGLRLASQSFTFLGFQIIYVRNRDTDIFRVKITPSKENTIRLSLKITNIIKQNKASSAYKLINILKPVIIGWGNYFRYCECKETFSKMDNVIWNKIRAWVFRRAVRQGRKTVKEKYFPTGNEYIFQGRSYKGNWILNGAQELKNGEMNQIHLPKLSWISSQKHVKIKGSASIYDGNDIYWGLRLPKYASLSSRVTTLLQRQKGKCTVCHGTFNLDDVMEVDHIQPRSQGGKDSYDNLQLLHRYCHTQKTKRDTKT